MKTKHGFVLVLFLLAGGVVGGLIAELTHGIRWLSWLSYGGSFGIATGQPLLLDLSFFKLTFGCTITLNIAIVIGLVGAVLAYSKLK